MSWNDSMLDASFRGIKFDVINTRDTFSRDVAQYEYPFVDGGDVDDEGVAVIRRTLIADGVLQSWLLNTSSAVQLGLETTGHASRGLAGPAGVSGHNLTIEPGERDLAALMADAGSGLLVTSMFGPSLNPNTGDWSAGVSGQWFENGQIVHAVNEVTIAGNLLALYQRLVPGSDLELRSASNSPSPMIDAVAIAGA